jgi:hypothetical protein
MRDRHTADMGENRKTSTKEVERRMWGKGPREGLTSTLVEILSICKQMTWPEAEDNKSCQAIPIPKNTMHVQDSRPEVQRTYTILTLSFKPCNRI